MSRSTVLVVAAAGVVALPALHLLLGAITRTQQTAEPGCTDPHPGGDMTEPNDGKRRIYVRHSFVAPLNVDDDFYGDDVETLEEFVKRAQNDSDFYELLETQEPTPFVEADYEVLDVDEAEMIDDLKPFWTFKVDRREVSA